MKRYPPDQGPTRAAPPYFPYRHPSLALVWAREEHRLASPTARKAKSFCTQCDSQVDAYEIARCLDRFCKGVRP